MTLLNKLTLTEYKSQIAQNPLTKRRLKLAAKLDEQIQLFLNPQYQPTKTAWSKDSEGNQYLKEQPKRIKRWWYEQLDGTVILTVRYGSKALELAKGKNAIVLKRKEDVETTLLSLKQSVLNGELDELLATQIGFQSRAK